MRSSCFFNNRIVALRRCLCSAASKVSLFGSNLDSWIQPAWWIRSSKFQTAFSVAKENIKWFVRTSWIWRGMDIILLSYVRQVFHQESWQMFGSHSDKPSFKVTLCDVTNWIMKTSKSSKGASNSWYLTASNASHGFSLEPVSWVANGS